MTPAQSDALQDAWPQYGLDYAQELIDFDVVFERNAPRELEIGFGNGDTLLALAERHPERDFIGIEVHRPGVGSLLRRASAMSLHNLRVSMHDAVEVLRDQVPPASLSAVHLYFPDPWPKKRHHKRRIVQRAFVELVAERLVDGGRFHLATDWEPYAEWMLEVIAECDALENADAAGAYSPRSDERPVTRFERRGEKLGHSVKDLSYRRRTRR